MNQGREVPLRDELGLLSPISRELARRSSSPAFSKISPGKNQKCQPVAAERASAPALNPAARQNDVGGENSAAVFSQSINQLDARLETHWV